MVEDLAGLRLVPVPAASRRRRPPRPARPPTPPEAFPLLVLAVLTWLLLCILKWAGKPL